MPAALQELGKLETTKKAVILNLAIKKAEIFKGNAKQVT